MEWHSLETDEQSEIFMKKLEKKKKRRVTISLDLGNKSKRDGHGHGTDGLSDT